MELRFDYSPLTPGAFLEVSGRIVEVIGKGMPPEIMLGATIPTEEFNDQGKPTYLIVINSRQKQRGKILTLVYEITHIHWEEPVMGPGSGFSTDNWDIDRLATSIVDYKDKHEKRVEKESRRFYLHNPELVTAVYRRLGTGQRN